MDVIFHYFLGEKHDRACRAHAHTEHGNRSTFQTGLWDGVVRTRTCHGVNRFSVLYIVVISQRENADKKENVPWSPPPPDWIKLNVDAGFDPHSGLVGLGFIARNHVGEVLFSGWSCNQ